MECKCAFAMGKLSWPLEDGKCHRHGKCKWSCCDSNWNEISCRLDQQMESPQQSPSKLRDDLNSSRVSTTSTNTTTSDFEQPDIDEWAGFEVSPSTKSSTSRKSTPMFNISCKGVKKAVKGLLLKSSEDKQLQQAGEQWLPRPIINSFTCYQFSTFIH